MSLLGGIVWFIGLMLCFMGALPIGVVMLLLGGWLYHEG